jgi:hypothetical protein
VIEAEIRVFQQYPPSAGLQDRPGEWARSARKRTLAKARVAPEDLYWAIGVKAFVTGDLLVRLALRHLLVPT